MPLTHGKAFYPWHKLNLIPFTWDIYWCKYISHFGEIKEKYNCDNHSSRVIIVDDMIKFYEIHKTKACCIYWQYCLIHLQMGRVAQLQDIIWFKNLWVFLQYTGCGGPKHKQKTNIFSYHTLHFYCLLLLKCVCVSLFYFYNTVLLW